MILGVTGTNGSGKGTVVRYLVEEKGFSHYSARGVIVAEIQRRGIAVDRTSMREVANDLRKEHGPAYIVETLFKQAKEKGGDAVIESVRTLGEGEFLKTHGAYLLAVDATRLLRYERAILRGSETDRVTFEQFCEQEDREMESPDAWDMNVFGVMQMADYTIMNMATPEDLPPRINAMLDTLRREDAKRDA